MTRGKSNKAFIISMHPEVWPPQPGPQQRSLVCEGRCNTSCHVRLRVVHCARPPESHPPPQPPSVIGSGLRRPQTPLIQQLFSIMNPVVSLQRQELGVGRRRGGGWGGGGGGGGTGRGVGHSSSFSNSSFVTIAEVELIPRQFSRAQSWTKRKKTKQKKKKPDKARRRPRPCVWDSGQRGPDPHQKPSADTFSASAFISSLLSMHQIAYQGRSVTDCRAPRRSTSLALHISSRRPISRLHCAAAPPSPLPRDDASRPLLFPPSEGCLHCFIGD